MKKALGADLVIPALALGFAAYFFVSIADLAWEAKANGVVIGGILVALIVIQCARIGIRVLQSGEANLDCNRSGSRAKRSENASAWCSSPSRSSRR